MLTNCCFALSPHPEAADTVIEGGYIRAVMVPGKQQHFAKSHNHCPYSTFDQDLDLIKTSRNDDEDAGLPDPISEFALISVFCALFEHVIILHSNLRQTIIPTGIIIPRLQLNTSGKNGIKLVCCLSLADDSLMPLSGVCTGRWSTQL